MVSIDNATIDIKQAINRINSICDVPLVFVLKNYLILILAKVPFFISTIY